MAAEIELLKINQYVQNLTEITGVDGAYVYGIDDNGNSVRIAIATIAAKAKDYSAEIQALQSALQQKSNIGHQHQVSDVNGLNAELTSVKDRLQALEDADLDIDSELSNTSENPVQNKVIKGKIDELQTAINQKTDTTYSAGDGINIDGGNEISVKIDNDTITLDEQGRLKAAPAVIDSELSNTSENPVQNKVIKTELDAINSRFIPQIADLSKYEAQVGEIVQYKGESTDLYKKGYFYKFVGGEDKTIPANTKYIALSDDWGENAPKGYYTFEDWKNARYYIAKTYRVGNDEYSNMTTEDGTVLHKNALNQINFGFGCPPNQVGTYGNSNDGWVVSPVAVGDLAWDEEENIYKITEIQIVSGTLNLTLKIWRTAYKGKVKIGNNDNFVDISEALGTEFVLSYYFGLATYQPTYRLTNIDNSDAVLYLFAKHYYTIKPDANTEFYKSVFPIPMNSAHYHFEPLLGDITEGGFIQQTDSEPFVIPAEKWQRIDVQPASSQGGGTDNLEMFLDSDTSTLILRDKELGVLSAIDFSVFTKDGMLADAVLYNIAEEGIEVETPYLKLIFNTESGQKPIRVSLATLDISFAIDSELSATSHNAIENRIVTLALQTKASQTELDEVKQDIEDIRHSGAFLPTYDEETETLIY